MCWYSFNNKKIYDFLNQNYGYHPVSASISTNYVINENFKEGCVKHEILIFCYNKSVVKA